MFHRTTLSAVLALVALPLPAFAAPVYITVPGGGYVYEGTELPPSTDTAPIFQPPGINLPFDPAQAANASMQTVSWAHRNTPELADNSALIRTLAQTGDSFAEHWSRCEARYASYSVADNTYLDAGGVPRNCEL